MRSRVRRASGIVPIAVLERWCSAIRVPLILPGLAACLPPIGVSDRPVSPSVQRAGGQSGRWRPFFVARGGARGRVADLR